MDYGVAAWLLDPRGNPSTLNHLIIVGVIIVMPLAGCTVDPGVVAWLLDPGGNPLTPEPPDLCVLFLLFYCRLRYRTWILADKTYPGGTACSLSVLFLFCHLRAALFNWLWWPGYQTLVEIVTL